MTKIVIVTITLLLLSVNLLIASCDDNEKTPTLGARPTGTSEPVIITIGNLTDQTGPGATAMSTVNKALEDLVKYYNDKNLIPGAELRVINYDGHLEPSQDIPGYEWLMERGSDLIWTSVPATPMTLNSRVNRDQVILFCATGNLEEFTPGYAFNLGPVPQHEAFTLLKWIAENHWDYQSKGPARIGGAAWADSYSDAFMNAMKEYAKAHPDQFEWAKDYLTDFKFAWQTEVEGLKNCDYVFVPTPMHIFVEQYRNAGYTATFIGSDTHTAFLGMIDKSDLWDEIDGMLFIRHPRWWNEEGTIIDLTKKLLYENHPDSAEEIMRDGSGYMAVYPAYLMLNIIANAVKDTGGPINFDSQALYDAATSFSMTIDGIERYSFDDTKRYVPNYYAIYEASATDENLFRVDAEWLHRHTTPE